MMGEFSRIESDRVDINKVVLTLWPIMFIQAYLFVFLAVDVREYMKKILHNKSAVIQIEGIKN